MKYLTAMAGTLLCLHTGAFAQAYKTNTNAAPGSDRSVRSLKNEPRFILTVHGGYALALGSTFKFYPDDISSINVEMRDNTLSSKTMSYHAPKKGLGEGFRAGIGLSYILNDFINVGLDIDYFRSTIRKIKDSSFHQVISSGPVSEYNYNERYTISYDATLITFTHNLTFKAISRPKWFLYNRVGAVINFRPNSIQNETQSIKSFMNWQGFIKDSTATNKRRYEWGIKNPSFGFMGSIGVQLKITERIRAYTEVQFSHIVFVVTRRSLTSYSVDGKEMVNTLPVSEREVAFKTDFRSEEYQPDPNKPAVAITQRIPITYVGLQAGLAYRF
jgi:hypothetical protein